MRALRAGVWLTIAHGGTQVIRLAGNLALTRLLAPELFGIISVASSLQIIISLLSDIGLHQAVIQSPFGEDIKFLNTAWSLQILRGWIIWFVCLATAIALKLAVQFRLVTGLSVYADSRLPIVIASTSVSAIILGYQSMRAVLHSRRLDVRLLTYIELISFGLGLAVSTLIAYSTHSVWAFVFGGIVSSAITTLLSHVWLPGPPDRLGWNADALSHLRDFGKWAFLSSTALALSMNGDRLLLGLWLSPTVLGYYSIAVGLATMVEGIGNRLFSSLSFPALSEVARENYSRFSKLYFKMRWLSDSVFVCMAGFLAASSDRIVQFLYDPRYAPAGPMLYLLSFSLIFNRYNLAGHVYLAAGRLSYASALNWVKVASLFCLVPTGYHFWGIPGAILGVSLHRAPTTIFIYIFDNRLKLLSLPLEFSAVPLWLFGWGAGEAFNMITNYLYKLT